MQDVNIEKEADMSKLSSDLRVVTYDIETAPLVVYTWEPWGTNWRAIKVVEGWYILSFAMKELGKKAVCYTLSDFPGYNPKKPNDKKLCKKLWEMFDDYDIVVGHNSIKFDNKKAFARFAYHHFERPSDFRSIDTLREVRKLGKFTSNKLDDICEHFGLGRKTEHEGFGLWEKVMAGSKVAWAKMRKYNIQDVVITERLYLYLRSWMTTHPAMVPVVKNGKILCQGCGSVNTKKRGFRYSGNMKRLKRQQWRCGECGFTTPGVLVKE